MATSRRPIFRSKVMEYYASSRQMDILPRIATPRVFVFLWILLGLLIMASLIAWLGQIPLFASGSGIIEAQPGSNWQVAAVFLPENSLSRVRPGQAVQLQIAATGQRFKGSIDKVETGIISPAQARRQYSLGDAGPLVVPGPSIVVMVKFNSSLSGSMYRGSIIYAQAQVGSQRMLSLLPGLNALIGD